MTVIFNDWIDTVQLNFQSLAKTNIRKQEKK